MGRTIATLAHDRGVEPLEAIVELALDEDLTTRFRSILANDDEEMIEQLLGQEGMLIGLSDAGAHVSQLCDACLPTDLLGNWVREREVLTLEAAVHKLTGEPAGVFGFDDRGCARTRQGRRYRGVRPVDGRSRGASTHSRLSRER